MTNHAKDDNNEDAAKLAEVHLCVPACRSSWARVTVLLHPPATVLVLVLVLVGSCGDDMKGEKHKPCF